jgi:hypothetical protein
MLKGIVVLFKELPTPIRKTTILYGCCLVGYNIIGTYIDSKLYLNKYREGNLHEIIDEYKVKQIKNDWDAVKFGAGIHFYERLWDSIVWPINLIQNTVPVIVLLLNPK